MSSHEIQELLEKLHTLEIRVVKLEQLVRFVSFGSGVLTIGLQVYSIFFKH